MPTGTVDKLKQTKASFPDRPPRAVIGCPFNTKQAGGAAGDRQRGSDKGTVKRKGHWIEIVLVGIDDQPVPDARYRIMLPDGLHQEGRLDKNGKAGYYGLTSAGNCTITFPDLDKDAWA